MILLSLLIFYRKIKEYNEAFISSISHENLFQNEEY